MRPRSLQPGAVLLLLAGTIAFALEWQECLPGARNYASTILDAANRRAIVFGGDGTGGLLRDVWEATPTDSTSFTWSRLDPTGPAPDASWGHRAVYDCNAQRMLVFGGCVGGSFSNRVWSLDLTPRNEHWDLLAPAGSPPAGRALAYTVFHPVRNSLITFGGSNANTWFSDVYELKLDSMAWRRVSVGGSSPSGRSQGCAAYDATADRMVIATGHSSAGFFNEVWAMSLVPGGETWTQLTPTGYVSPRAGSAWGWDPATGRLFVFGGICYGVGLFDDLHVLDLAADSWIDVGPSGALPAARRGAAGTYFTRVGDFLVLGGESERGFCGDALFIQLGATGVGEWSPTPTPSEPTLFVVGVSGRPVRLRFAAGLGSAAEVRILDAVGRIVRTLCAGAPLGSSGVLDWDGRDEVGQSVPAGTYYVCLLTDRTGVSQKFVLTE